MRSRVAVALVPIFVALAASSCKRDSTQHPASTSQANKEPAPPAVVGPSDAAPASDGHGKSAAPMPQSLVALRTAIKPWLTRDETGEAFCASPSSLKQLVALAKTAAAEPAPPGVNPSNWRDVVRAVTDDVLEIDDRDYCKEEPLGAQENLEDTVKEFDLLVRVLNGESWK